MPPTVSLSGCWGLAVVVCEDASRNCTKNTTANDIFTRRDVATLAHGRFDERCHLTNGATQHLATRPVCYQDWPAEELDAAGGW
ncbi:hypothetical protein [Aporhodopirellula aestuarii]|uniref:Secreted protein n=1 Tax=Aporhodopirellula aestuarii TaxID=2950107 RepID=A0ABT0UDN7_9BACT|nr:hypothetical protein [Aporhodopirellula aestuarii]MCM2374897.1 hypothetical protein [Aporhodopirellula aestuarii]